MPKLDVVLGRGSVAQPNRLADDEGHGFRFGLADLLGGEGAAFATMQHLVSDLMHERGELLGWLHPGQQRDLSAVRETLCGSNSLGEAKLDVLRFHELEQPFAVSAHVAVDFGQGGEFLAFGLADVENVDGPEPVQRGLAVFCCGITRLVGRSSFVLRLPTIGARMKMPFSPRLTKRPSEFHVRIPATLVASGFWRAMSMMLPKLNVISRTM